MSIKIPQQFQFLFKPKRYKVMFSGRMAAKSWSIAIVLLIQGAQKKLRILCSREFQNSITDSVHKLLSDMNERYKLGYVITQHSIKHPATGTEFLFYGLKTNITKIKSLEGIDICWVEESETVSEESLDVLIPTIRKQGSEMWFSFNPGSEADAVYKMFVIPHQVEIAETGKYVDQQHYILKTHYSKNPFLSQTAHDTINKLKSLDYNRYKHIYGGEPLFENEYSIIQPAWFDAAIDAHNVLKFKAIGAKSIGYDPADGGADKQAMVFSHGSVVKMIEEWNDGALEEGCTKVYNYAEKQNVQSIIYDSIGIGTGVRIKLNEFDPNNVIEKVAFNGASTPINPKVKYKDDQTNEDIFKNLRAQYYWALRDRFENTYRAVELGEYVDPEEMISISSECKHLDNLKLELTAIRRVQGLGRNLIQIEGKPAMRKRGQKSPNIADALMYSFASKNESKKLIPIPNIVYASQW